MHWGSLGVYAQRAPVHLQLTSLLVGFPGWAAGEEGAGVADLALGIAVFRGDPQRARFPLCLVVDERDLLAVGRPGREGVDAVQRGDLLPVLAFAIAGV